MLGLDEGFEDTTAGADVTGALDGGGVSVVGDTLGVGVGSLFGNSNCRGYLV